MLPMGESIRGAILELFAWPEFPWVLVLSCGEQTNHNLFSD